jgi:plastocyanin
MKRLLPALLLCALVSCGGDGGDSGQPSMEGHAFTPETRTVAAGDTVEWVNDTEEAHTVTAVEGSLPDGAEYFSSGRASSEEEATGNLADELIEPGESFEWTFDEPGTYRYYCIPHRGDGMEGSVVVE